MQLYACDSNNRLTTADSAQKGVDYRCPECAGVVRVRKGSHKQPHFFHLTHNRNCRQSGKSAVHLAIQNHLLNILPKGEVSLECRFPEKGRIADVVWMPKRLIFEVQCSPISAEEVASRNSDYSQLGFQVVWLFHDFRFNSWRVTAAENSLWNRPFYYTNMNAKGEGIIYDQTCKIHQGVRRKRSQKSRVDLTKPLPTNGGVVRFSGDLFHEKTKPVPKGTELINSRLKWYWNVFRVLLERSSR